MTPHVEVHRTPGQAVLLRAIIAREAFLCLHPDEGAWVEMVVQEPLAVGFGGPFVLLLPEGREVGGEAFVHEVRDAADPHNSCSLLRSRGPLTGNVGR